jgi:transcriptional regulator with XRE-family HTH domain
MLLGPGRRGARGRGVAPLLPCSSTKLLCATLKSVNRVKDLRIARGFTAAELAEKSGVGYRTVRRVERSLVRPHPRTLQRLAEALGVEPSELARLMSEVAQDPKRKGSFLRDLRIASGMSQPELARRAGINQAFLSQLERGKHEAGPSTVRKLAEALGVHPLELITT